jgi:hypothetical protein
MWKIAFSNITKEYPIFGFNCRTGGNNPKWIIMTNTIRWPDGEFTLSAAVELNAGVSQAEIRKKLSTAIAAKTIVHIQKGDGKIPGKFKAVK